MFAKKLVFIAAAVALAMTPAVALDKQTAHVKIHIVHGVNHKQVELAAANATSSRAGSGAEETAVGDDDENDEEEEDDDSEAALESSSKAGSSSSAKGDADVGDEEEEEGADEADEVDEVDEVDEESGENEDAVVVDAAAPKNGTAPASPLCTGKDESPMSVEGVEGIFCVTGQACVADIVGACPDKQEGLPLGAYCGKVVTGVLGCKPNTEETLKNAHKYHAEAKHLAKALDVKFQRVVKKAPHKKH